MARRWGESVVIAEMSEVGLADGLRLQLVMQLTAQPQITTALLGSCNAREG